MSERRGHGADDTARAHRMPAVTRMVWALARAAASVFYRVERAGARVPDGPLLLVANHPNGLLDPALVVATSGRVPRFLAKSTLFAGSPYAFLIRWSGAIPVYRRQDAEDPAKNREMFAGVARALARGEAVCLFPEGISHSGGRLAPLKTGAARMALSARAAGIDVRLMAVGLNFSDKGVFRSPALIAYGPAFGLDDLPDSDDALAPERVEPLTDRIAERLRDVLIEADAIDDLRLVSIVERLYSATRGLPADPPARHDRQRTIAKGLDVLRARDPERVAGIVAAVRHHVRRLARFGVTVDQIAGPPPPLAALRFAAREVPMALVLLPLSAATLVLFGVPYAIVDAMARHRRVEHEVQSTVKVVGGAFVYALWSVFLATAAGWMWGAAAFVVALPGSFAIAVAGVFAIEHELDAFGGIRTWWALQRLPSQAVHRLGRRQRELTDLLDQVQQWINGDHVQSTKY